MADNYVEVKTAYLKNDQNQGAQKAQEHLDKYNNVPVKIAITGESGSGKSTLVNALRGIRNDAEGAAPTGVTETTMKPTEYIHPEIPHIKFWDLPGMGTTKFSAAKYLKLVEFEKYDFFIIVSETRFRENDAKLAKEIHKKKKKFYFVRSKIDHNIRDERESNPNTTEEEVLDQVRDDCTKKLQELGFESSKIFLVSGLKLHLYGFKDLKKALLDDLPEHQRDVLTLALPNISQEAIKQKIEILESKIKWYTLSSTAVAAVPVPGLSEAVDLSIIVAFTVHCATSLGLTPKCLRKLSELSGVPLKDLLNVIKSDFAGVEITIDLITKVLGRCAVLIAAMAIEEGTRFIPLIGIPFAMVISGITTYKILKFILKELAEDAEEIFIKAWL